LTCLWLVHELLWGLDCLEGKWWEQIQKRECVGEESERDWGTFEIDEYEREGVLTLQIPADALHPPLQ
jgi:hypothetical protein